MKNNNKGLSLIELIVVIAISAVLLGIMAYSLSLLVGWDARACTKKLSSQLDEVKTGCMSRGNEEMTIQYHAKDNTPSTYYTSNGIYVEKNTLTIDENANFVVPLETEIEKIASDKVVITCYLSDGTSLVIDSVHPTNSLTICFKRSTGAFDSVKQNGTVLTGIYVSKIEVKSGSKILNIVTDINSGKHAIQ